MVTKSTRMFPILHRQKKTDDWTAPLSIPWFLLEPHENQAEKNHGQSLKRLAERGGLCPSEAIAIIEERDLFTVPHDLEAQKIASKKLWERIW